MRPDPAYTRAQGLLEKIKARQIPPDHHNAREIIEFTARSRFLETNGIFCRSNVTIAGIVRAAKVLRRSEWTKLQKYPDLRKATLSWLNEAESLDGYQLHYQRMLQESDPALYKHFVLVIRQIEVALHMWKDDRAALIDRLTREEGRHGDSGSVGRSAEAPKPEDPAARPVQTSTPACVPDFPPVPAPPPSQLSRSASNASGEPTRKRAKVVAGRKQETGERREVVVAKAPTSVSEQHTGPVHASPEGASGSVAQAAGVPNPHRAGHDSIGRDKKPPVELLVSFTNIDIHANGIPTPAQTTTRRKGQLLSQGVTKARRHKPYTRLVQNGQSRNTRARESKRRDAAAAASHSPQPTAVPYCAPSPPESFWFSYASALVGALFKGQIPHGRDGFAERCLARLPPRHSDRIGQFELWASYDPLPRAAYLEINERYRLYLMWNEDAIFDIEDAFENLFRCAVEIAEGTSLSGARWLASRSLEQIVEDKLADVSSEMANL